MHTLFALIASILFFAACYIDALKISDVSVLIPWEGSGFKLFVNSTSSSCVEWTTDSPHVIQLQYEMCSSVVNVIPIKNAIEEFGEKKVSTIVSVFDGVDRASCEVYLGRLHKIEMLTSARNLYLGEVDTLDIIGFDEEGNSFETLRGLQFDWRTEKITNNLKDGAIRLLPLNDVNVRLYIDPTKHSNSDYISSQTIICEGLEIGQARVVVSWRNDNKVSDAVDFSVYDKFSLKPNAYMRVIPTSIFTYQLYKRNLKKEMIHVTMPNPRFAWSSSLTSVGTIHSQLGTFTAKEVGITYIYAKDLTFEQNSAKGTVQVVTPARIAFKFIPASPALYEGYEEVRKLYSDNSIDGGNLVIDVDYNVEIELFDDKNQKVILTDNIQFEVTVQSEGDLERTKIIKLSKNMHSFEIKTLAIGEALLKARLIGEVGEIYSVTNTQTLHVYPRVNIAYPETYLNLPATNLIQQKYKLSASGGSNHHKWITLSSDVATVDSYGVVSTKFHGTVRVFVFDIDNVFNGDVRWVRVSQPHQLQFAPGKRETAVGTHLCLKLKLIDTLGNVFAAFDAFKITTKIGDYNIYSDGKGACSSEPNSFEVLAIKIGYTTFQAKLVGLELKEEIPIVAFDPLGFKIPKNDAETIIIALGSTQPIVLTGGPVEWGNYQIYRSSYVSVRIIDSEHQNIIPVYKDDKRKSHLFFFATCRDLGERVIDFEVTNDIHVRDAEKTIVHITKRIICTHPEKAILVPHSPIGGEDRYDSKELTPIDENASLLAYHVAINTSIILKLDLYDKNGNKFTSFNSLVRNYILSNNELGRFPDNVITFDGKRYLHIGSKEGLLLSHGKILSFDSQVLKEARVLVQPPKLTLITPEIQLRTNVPIELNPKKMLLFNHPSITGEFVVSGGSDEYNIRSVPSQIISHEITGKSIIVTPRSEGETSLIVQDSRFESHQSVKGIVSVADIAFIEIEGSHYIELGENAVLTLRVYDKQKREFDVSQFTAMQPNLISHSPSSIIDIAQQRFHLYVVHGKALGTIDVIASVTNSNSKVIRSQPFQIHVYPPLRVEPPKLILIPGAKYQVKLIGGPSFDKNSYSYTENEIIFSEVDKSLARKSWKSTNGEDAPVITIDKRNVVTGITYGKAVVRLRRNIGGKPFASKEVEIYVVKLQSLNFPISLNMYDDSILPINFRSSSTEGHTVGALSTQSPFFTLTYTLEDSEIVKVLPPSSLGHALNLEALKPGHTKIRVNAKFAHPHLDSYSLDQEILVYVVEKLRLFEGCTSKIIVSPKTNHKVLTNRGSSRYFIHYVNDEPNQITVGEVSGRLSTGNSGETAILHVRDLLSGQSIATKVEVHDPSYLGIEGNINTIFLPLGSSKTLKYHGLNKFAEKMASIDGVEISYISNMYEHLDIVIDTNSETIQLKALTTGNTTIQLYSPSVESIFDFKVVVMSTIRPSNPNLIVGDKLQFQISSTEGDKQGFWSSTDSSVLQIDPVKGIASAKSSGITQVHFTSNSLSSSSQVYVKKISSAQLSTSRKYVLINRRERTNDVFKVPVALFDQDGEYISLDTNELPQSLTRKLNIECQSTNSLIRVVRSEIVKERVICTIQHNPSVQLNGESRIENVHFILHISDGISTYSVQSDNFHINLTDQSNPKIDTSIYMIGERLSTPLASPKIIDTIANSKQLLYQISVIIFTLILGFLIYKCFVTVGYRIALASSDKKKRKLPPPDVKFDKYESMYDSNGVKLRQY